MVKAKTAPLVETSFTGFPKQTFAFLSGIAAHNEKIWFDANRDLYEAGYVAPARAFVEALGPLLREVSPGVQFSSKVNGSLQRVNRDIRFSKDKRPYKEHLNLWFWHNDKSWDTPGFWFGLGPKEVQLSVGMYGLGKERLDSFRQSIVHPRSGKALLAAVADVRKAGDYEIGGKTRKLMPRGFTADADRADYLLYDGLYASATLPAAAAARPDFANLAASHFKKMWPVGKWLLDEVAG
jgi:uncharacterized protein (TIGR02453 family)